MEMKTKLIRILVMAIFLVVSAMSSISIAKESSEQGVQPDSPIVATWSKIKELFE